MALESSQNSFRRSETARADIFREKIVFVGGSLTFSDRVLAVLQAEFPDLDFLRVKQVADLAIARRMNDHVRLAVFEPAAMQAFLDDPARFEDAAGTARVVFVLDHPAEAARFLIAHEAQPRRRDIGFLPLAAQMDVWISVMHLLLCNQNFVPESVASALIALRDKAPVPEVDDTTLTQREWQVLEMVSQGTQNKVIAADLDLSVHTVKLHIHNVLKKIGVTNRTCAAGWYMQNHGLAGDGLRQ
jgi:DNA-binding NarL/FixJ family response regulator